MLSSQLLRLGHITGKETYVGVHEQELDPSFHLEKGKSENIIQKMKKRGRRSVTRDILSIAPGVYNL